MSTITAKTTLQAMERQPDGNELDFAAPTQYRFQVQKLPDVTFFLQVANIPGIAVDQLTQPTPLNTIAIAGSDLSYEDLSMTFLIDEEYRNYRTVHAWLKGLSFPENHTQFADLLNENKAKFKYMLEELSPREFVTVYLKLVPYIITMRHLQKFDVSEVSRKETQDII